MSTPGLEDALSAMRWLAPDAEIDQLGADASAFFESCADELSGCFERVLASDTTMRTRRELTPLAVYVTRSASEALERWCRACASSVAASEEDLPWCRALQAVISKRMQLERPPVDLPREIRAFRRALDEERLALPDPWRPAWSFLLPGFFTVHRHLRVGGLLAQREHGALASPWGPLVQLWSRGCWPVLTPTGELIVWVPARRGAAIVLEPDERSVSPQPLTIQRLYGGEWLPPGRLALLLIVSQGAMRVQPLAPSSVISSRTGMVSAGTAFDRMCGTITRSKDRYVVTMQSDGLALHNGEPARSFVLNPGDEVEVFAERAVSTMYYLGPKPEDAGPTAEWDGSLQPR